MNLLDLTVKIGAEDNATSQVASIAEKAQSAVSSMASKLSSVYSGVQTATGAIVGTVGTLAATGGIDRALSIESAEAKLKGLGHTGDDLTAIMNNAKNAVSGTSYGLGEAASAAGVLAAAGIEAGDGVGQMQGVLQTIGAVATVSGREFSDISSIFGKVAANGKLTTESMLQLQDSGIPVLSMLAQHFGKTTEEMQKMVTDGEVSFQDFNAVMNENMGQAAVVAGQTFPSAIKNMRAALSKTGAEIATPLLEDLRQVVLALNPVLNALVPVATQMGDAISQHLEEPVRRITDFLGQLKEKISGGDLASSFSSISPAVVGVGAALAAFSSGGIVSLLSNVPLLGSALGSMSGVFGALGGPIGVALAALLGFGLSSGSLQENFAPVIKELGEKLPGALETVMGWFEQLAPVFEPVINAFMQLLAAVVPVVSQFVEGLGNAISTFVVPMLELLAPVLTQLMENLAGLMERLEPVANVLGAVIGVALAAIIAVLGTVLDVLSWIIEGINSFIDILSQGSEGVSGFIDGVVGFFTSLPETIATFLSNIITSIGEWVVNLGTSAIEAGSGFFNNIVNFFSQLPGNIWNLLVQVLTSINDWCGSIISKAWEAGSNFLSNIVSFFTQLPGNIWNFLCEVINNIGNFVNDMGSKAWDAANNFGRNLLDTLWSLPQKALDAGRAIIQGIIDGIEGMINNAKNAISGVVDAIASFLPHSPAKQGAFSGRGWTPYAGRAIVQGLAEGIEDMADEPVSAIDDVMNGISGAMSAEGNVNVNSSGGMAGTAESLARVESLLTQLLSKDTTLYMDSTKVSAALNQRANATLLARGVA